MPALPVRAAVELHRRVVLGLREVARVEAARGDERSGAAAVDVRRACDAKARVREVRRAAHSPPVDRDEVGARLRPLLSCTKRRLARPKRKDIVI